MDWGNAEVARELLKRIAHRQGKMGEVLAEGVKRAAETIGGEAPNIGVYIQKGHAPRGHDHRARWAEIVDYAVSGTGTMEVRPVAVHDRFNVEEIATTLAKKKTLILLDSLVVCSHSNGVFGGTRWRA